MYGKIYEQTFTGSMYGSGSHIFSVWSYVIAHTKPDAMVELNPKALASTIGEDESRIEAAIEHFKSPDPKSRSKEFEGRRLIQKGEFIYFVPQYHKYHGFANNKERREYFAEKKRAQRQRDRERQTVMSKESKNVQQSDSDTESKTKKDVGAKGSPTALNFPNGLTDSEWIAELKTDKTYQGIDVNREHGKMINWCKAHSKSPTRRRFVNWLNRVDKPMGNQGPKEPAPIYAKAQPPLPPLTEQEIERNKKLSAKMVNDLKNKMRP